MIKKLLTKAKISFNNKALLDFTAIPQEQRDALDFRTALNIVSETVCLGTSVTPTDLLYAYAASPYSAYDKTPHHEKHVLLNSNPDLYEKLSRMSDEQRMLYMMSMFINDSLDDDPTLSHLRNQSPEQPAMRSPFSP